MRPDKRQPMPSEGAGCRAELHELCSVPHTCPCSCHERGTDLGGRR